jgi:hypothetical protein
MIQLSQKGGKSLHTLGRVFHLPTVFVLFVLMWAAA